MNVILSGDWLYAQPLSSVGLKLDKATVRFSAGLRLGAPVVRPHACACGAMVTADGHHGLSCRRGSGRHSRHNQINDLQCRAFVALELWPLESHKVCVLVVVNDRMA